MEQEEKLSLKDEMLYSILFIAILFVIGIGISFAWPYVEIVFQWFWNWSWFWDLGNIGKLWTTVGIGVVVYGMFHLITFGIFLD